MSFRFTQPLPNFTESDMVFSALSVGDSHGHTPTPTVNDRMWPALWCPGINRECEQARDIVFAAPLWEAFGKPRDYVSGNFQDGDTAEWGYSDELAIYAEPGITNVIKFLYDGPPIKESWTICGWFYWTGSSLYRLRNYTNASTPAQLTDFSGLWHAMDGEGGDVGCGTVANQINKNQWYFIAYQCNPRNDGSGYDFTTWVDGERSTNCFNDVNIDDVEGIEFAGGNSRFKDFRIYNRWLIEGELLQIKNHPSELWTHNSTQALLDFTLIFADGGVVCGGASIIGGSVTGESGGGVVCGSSADVSGGVTLPIGGRVLVKGNAVPTGPMTFTPSGRIIMGGSAKNIALNYRPPIGGRVLVKGNASLLVYYTIEGDAIVIGGTATPVMTYNDVTDGGVVCGSPSFPGGYTLRTTVTVPAGEVTADLTKFYLALVLDIDATSALVTDESGTVLSSYVHKYDGEKIWLYVKTDLDTSSDNLFYVYHN